MNSAPQNRLHTLIEPLSALSLWLKIAVVLLVSVIIKAQPTQPTWAVAMPVFAALVLVPIGIQLISEKKALLNSTSTVLNSHLVVAILLAISFIFDQSKVAGCLALPYFLWCLVLVLRLILALILRGPSFRFSLTNLMTLAAFGFLTNAAAWLVFDRLGYQPLGFTAWIVLLTGAHFHYAGFALTLSLALLLSENPNNLWAKTASRGVLSGVVLTATGITTTQLGYSHFIETMAGVWMSASAFLAGIAFILRGLSEKSNVRFLFIIGGVCLLLGMVLAFFYALRTIIPLPFLTIPTMQAIHGSLNALGFGTLTLFAFALVSHRVHRGHGVFF
jgi:YndJ-like protein